MGTSSNKGKYLAREAILELLTNDETAKVARAESEPLVEGDEYIDLSNIAGGVHQVHAGATTPERSVLPRSAVSDKTWARIITRIG
ncbi:MAG: hypothetical protein FWD69_07185 [Polyangiaceae bacterium]|nr:hypothetical protein [Polyangiaceae bacterium]